MQAFEYQSLTAAGDARTGVVEAESKAEAIRQLLLRGETATVVEPLRKGVKPKARPKPAARRPAARPGSAAQRPRTGGAKTPTAAQGFSLSVHSSRTGSMSKAELASFIRELATALEAGLPLMQSLRTMRKQAHTAAMIAILDHLIDRVEAGDPLHTAAADYGRPFDDMIVGMMRAADASGRMDEILHQLADLLERSVELRREVLGATMYPLIVFALIGVSATILVTVLVPRLILPLADTMANMPWPTEVVLAIASFLQAYWLWLILAAGAAYGGWRFWSTQPGNRVLIDGFLLRIPVLGRLLRDVAVARFTRTLGTLTSAGLPILDSIRITKNTLGNRALMAAMDEVQEQVAGGKPLADPLESSGLFPPMLIQVVNLGERSGRLETMLLHAAKAFDRQVNNSLNLFTKSLPPVLLAVMAALGGFVLAAVLLPLLELQSAIGG
jgi:type II secretory pathway component PulF